MPLKNKTEIRVAEPVQSDTTLLLTVDDLIRMAMGPEEQNVVNFKLIEKVLYMLARKMKLLETKVEIRLGELEADAKAIHIPQGGIDEESSSASDEKDDKSGRDEGGTVGKGSSKGQEDDGTTGTRGKGTKGDKEGIGSSKGQEDDGTTGTGGKGTKGDKGGKGGSEGQKDDRTTVTGSKGTKGDKGGKGGSEGQEDDRTTVTGGKGTKGDKGSKGGSEGQEDDRTTVTGGKGTKGDKGSKGGSEGQEDDRTTVTGGKGTKGDKGSKGGSEGQEDDRTTVTGGKGTKGDKGSKGGSEGQEDDRTTVTGGKGTKGDKGSKGGSEGQEDDRTTVTGGKETKGDKGGKGGSKGQEDDVTSGGKRTKGDKGGDGKTGTGGKGSKARDGDEEGGTQGKGGKLHPAVSNISGGSGPQRVGSIEVVTQKEFAMLEAAVKVLAEKASVPPPPIMPDNKKLRTDIAKGSASLTDTMQAMQLSERIQAAETAIGNMAELITQMAASGVIPDDIKADFETIGREGDEAKSAAALPTRLDAGGEAGGAGQRPASAPTPGTGAASGTSGPSRMVIPSAAVSVTVAPSRTGATSVMDSSAQRVNRREMEAEMETMRGDIIKSIQNMTSRAFNAAEAAARNIKCLTDKMDVAMILDGHVTVLQGMVDDCAKQLAGFDVGLSTQVTGFEEQMATMRHDLNSGLAQLEQVNNNADTAAVLDLTERYEGLVAELDSTLNVHKALTNKQLHLTDELKSLVEAVEMMREQKADRDEVLDALRDKADASRLNGLLSEEQFKEARDELDMRIQMCYEKFRRQDAVWMNAVNDFRAVTEAKAEGTQLKGAREEIQEQLQELRAKVQRLAKLLGNPKAAIVTRHMSRGAVCNVPVLIDPLKPATLPVLPASDSEDEDEPCLRGVLLKQPDDGEPKPEPHMCLRWVGGSHTKIGANAGRGSVSREKAPHVFAGMTPVRRYLGYGSDGKLYKLQEDILPCEECNQFAPEEPAGAPLPSPRDKQARNKIPGEAERAPEQDGGGDQAVVARSVTVVYPSSARHVTVLDQKDLDNLSGAQTRSTTGTKSRRQLDDDEDSMSRTEDKVKAAGDGDGGKSEQGE